MSNQPLSERFYRAWQDWCDKKNAADMLEGMKSAFLAQKIKERGDMPYNKAERDVKSSDEWKDYLTKQVAATTAANRAKGNVEYLKMKYGEWQSQEANHRAQSRL